MAPRIGISLDAIYYSLLALASAYFLATGALAADAWVAYPLFFLILSAAALQLLLYPLQLFSALKKSVSAQSWEVRREMGYRGALVTLLGQAIALWLIYVSVPPSDAGGFFTPLALAFFAISLVQVFFHTYPKGSMGLGERINAWVESAYKFGSVPGMVALAGAAVGLYAFTPIFAGGAVSLKWAFAKFFIAVLAALALYMGFFRKGKETLIGGGNLKYAVLASLAFIAAFFLFEFLIKDFTRAQMVLAAFVSAYALLAYISHRQSQEGRECTPDF